MKVDEDTVWLNRQQLALLFGRDIKTIGKHIGNALREELNGFSVVAEFATTASDGKTYQVEHYNLDMILSVGYRVKSKEGIYFRRWANSVLKQHLVDGYIINRKQLDALHAVVKVLSRSTEPEIAGTAEILERYLPSLVLLNDYGTGVGVSVEEAIVPIAHLIDNPPHAALSAFIKTKPVDLTMNTFDRGKAVRLDDITKSC
ncbi:MAG: RhuM family protein [Bifidobacterium longum]|uniref:RhuM family protein n=2 Tax=Bifidobacterium longum TaxID=216816 RepID=UPI001E637815|nr:RhuM family protein [Bifidobacterium longum]WAT11464.1 RhuM family protein [Bifidobacterium longum subsp. infantis]